jgi:small subunit ribosomal protein S4
MKLGPKYKIARRLGAPIFEKTQTAKFKLKDDTKKMGGKKGGRGGKSDFSKGLIEKQKARFTYGVSEKQFANYVNSVLEAGSHTPVQDLFQKLETRIDNVVAKLGLASTRRHARQVVSHGHILVNGTRITIPSYCVRVGDVVSVREGSKSNGIFKESEERAKTGETPNWLAWDATRSKATVVRVPSAEGQDLLFDLGTVLEFYKR